jgi:membrane dipeptidase
MDTRSFARALAALVVTFSFTVSPAAAAAERPDPALERARKVLDRTILFDGHNDLPMAIREKLGPLPDLAKYDLRTRTPGHTDIARLRDGRVGAQFWSVYIPGEARGGYARTQLEQIAIARRVIAAYPDVFVLASTAADVERAHHAGRIASMLGMEGGYGIENSLGLLQAYYDLGVRYMALTHNVHLEWADSALQVPAKHGGLTEFGKNVVREMNRLGMLVDLSHASEATMHDALDVAQAPVIFSHSSARAIVDTPRNVPDSVLDRVRANGGVVMITFVAGFVSKDAANAMMPALAEYSLRAKQAATAEEREALRKEIFSRVQMPKTTIGQVADHVDYVAKRVGVEHVGIGSDFDGNEYWPEGLSDTSMYPNLFAELVRRGWSDADLARLAGGNVLRALREAEKTAARLQRAHPGPQASVTVPSPGPIAPRASAGGHPAEETEEARNFLVIMKDGVIHENAVPAIR